MEMDSGNFDRALKHFMISAEAGYDYSLEKIRQCSLQGHASKDDLKRLCGLTKKLKIDGSDQRDAAAAFVLSIDYQSYLYCLNSYYILPRYHHNTSKCGSVHIVFFSLLFPADVRST